MITPTENRIRILLVEDNEVDQFAFKRHAEKNNLPYDITVSPSMEETFLLLRTRTFDVVILDYMLQDGASSELVPHLVKNMQVIFVTGEEKLETAINAMKMGVYEYLVKDFEKSYLGMLPKIIDSAFKHKLASDRLLKAEKQVNRLSLAMSRMDSAVIIANAEGKVEWVNLAFSRLSGYSPSEILGTDGRFLCIDGLGPLNSDHPKHDKVFKEFKSVSYESVNVRKDGSKYNVISTITPVLKISGELQEVVIVEADISLQKQREQELAEAKRIAERSNQAKEQFLANMSHELRTPLNAVLGMVQMLEGTRLTDEQMEYMGAIRTASSNLTTLVEDVLDFTQLNTNRLEVKEEPINLGVLLQDLERANKLKVDQSKVNLLIEVDPDVPNNIQADPSRIQQILGNLFSNAIKFTNDGEIKMQAYCNDDQSKISFRIQDSGVGIAKDKLGSIFEMFEQEDMSDTRKYAGVGIGLSIVKSLLEIMNGDITIHSELNKGTVVVVTLPLKVVNDKKLDTNQSTKLSSNNDLNGIKVLLVEDNKMNQLLAKKFLNKLGASVEVAFNGKEAVDQMAANHFDLILMDLQMPVMDGFEATKIIRSNMGAVGQKIPIIAMTAHVLSGTKEKCLKMGLSEFIPKPILLESLRSKMGMVLSNTVN